MLPSITYHDRGDRILKVVTKSATERQTFWLPKPHTLGEGGIQWAPPAKGKAKEPRRIPTTRTGTAAAVPTGPGRGDRVETALTAIGVTKERWSSFKSAFGLGPTCNCEARKDWLNQVGDQLGDAAKDAVSKVFGER